MNPDTAAVIADEDGVAGFFEDLPVLMFVLAGVSCLVMSGAWVATETAERDMEASIRNSAVRYARDLVLSLTSEWGTIPQVTSIMAKNLTSRAEPDPTVCGFTVSVALLGPNQSVLVAESRGKALDASCTGFARVVFNAIDERGLVQILEARVIVWSDR